MWELQILGIDFFRVFYCFFIYCFVGWIWETCYCSVMEGRLINRGFLNGPYIPIYGFAATFIFMAFYNPMMEYLTTENSVAAYVTIFFIGAVVASIFEYITHFSMEKLFHAKWWDYSHLPLNIKGRICLPVSCFWGALSIVLVKVLHPIVLGWIDAFPHDTFQIVGYIIFVLFSVDVVLTVIVTVKLDKKITAIAKIREEFNVLNDEFKNFVTESKLEFRDKLGETTIGDFIEHGMDRIDATIAFGKEEVNQQKAELVEEINKRLGSGKVKREAFIEGAKSRMDQIVTLGREKYDENIGNRLTEYSDKTKAIYKKYTSQLANGIESFTVKRLSKAFPHMKFLGEGRHMASEDMKAEVYKKKDR